MDLIVVRERKNKREKGGKKIRNTRLKNKPTRRLPTGKFWKKRQGERGHCL